MAARGYAICAMPRSGSNYLCQLLGSTGVLGRPLDYFNAAGRRAWEDPDYPEDRPGQVRAILERGATPNGVYGVKLFPARFEGGGADGWIHDLPGLRFVRLQRRDLLGQAISWARASQTRGFRSNTPDAGGRADYSAATIASRLERIVRDQARWSLYFARNGVQPVELAYEAMAADPQAAVDAVAALMQIEAPAVIGPAQVQVAVQRDAESEAWRARFIEEAGDLALMETL